MAVAKNVKQKSHRFLCLFARQKQEVVLLKKRSSRLFADQIEQNSWYQKVDLQKMVFNVTKCFGLQRLFSTYNSGKEANDYDPLATLFTKV